MTPEQKALIERVTRFAAHLEVMLPTDQTMGFARISRDLRSLISLAQSESPDKTLSGGLRPVTEAARADKSASTFSKESK